MLFFDPNTFAHESSMYTVEQLQSLLNALNAERSQIASEGWYLQNCWLVELKPGGSARTERKYWQARSRQPIFDGKKLKHLKGDEVDDYKAVIARGRQLKLLDRQIEKIQKQIAQLTSKADSKDTSSTNSQTLGQILQFDSLNSPKKQAQSTVRFADVAEQERQVKEVLAKSQALRASLRQSIAISKKLAAKHIDIRKGHPQHQ